MRHLHKFPRLILLAGALCLFLSAFATAQEVTGSLVGTVKDANGGAVAGATVTITESDKKVVVRTVTTNDDGRFATPNLTSAFYDVTIEAPNFKKHVEKRVKLDVGANRSVDVSLEAGKIEEVVTVEASPLTVELTTPAVSTVINGDQVRELA